MNRKAPNTAPAVILPANFQGSGKKHGKACNEKEAINCLAIASVDLKEKVAIDFNPRSRFWTVKIGFIWGRDKDFIIAARDCLKRVLPLLDKK